MAPEQLTAMPPPFPFAAIVGQDLLKRALLLGVIHPGLGGVLIRGTKGVAKSTAVRALAGLLPPIETVAHCPFQRRPGEEIPDWPLPADAAVIRRPVPLVELPLGATEDRVLGALHLEKALRGERAFEPGLLAAANRGILYIDEVNLLPDHLVDLLLDAAAGGVHRVEREGLSLQHPARFTLIGTMNPEEGDLRPQLLDRFGLVADVKDLADATDRAEAVRRRLAYEADPAAFAATWQAEEEAEARRIVRARELLPQVRIGDALLRALSERCLAEGVEGLRADLTLGKAACAWAAYQGRTAVDEADLDAVAELALAHRRTQPPPPPPPAGGPGWDGSPNHARSEGIRGREAEGQTATGTSSGSALRAPRSAFESAGLFAPRPRPPKEVLAGSLRPGRWRGTSVARGRSAAGPVHVARPGESLAWTATLRAAAPYQHARGWIEAGGRLILRAADCRSRSPRGPAGCLLLFVVDASGSMAAWRRMRQTKSAMLALLVRAYQRRDQVAIVAFRGTGAELVSPPVRGLTAARRALEALTVGGTTPLAHGLAAACRLIHHHQRRHPRQPVWTVLLTDGRTNVAMASADPWQDALIQARALARRSAACLVVNTETGWPRLDRALVLARDLGAPCLGIEDVLGRRLPDSFRRAV